MNTLIMTVGLPRSGKSTWAMQQRHPIVNPDSIRLALHGQVDSEIMVWAIANYMVKSLFLAGHRVVILDATNITHANRERWKNLLWTRNYVVFKTGLETCLSRVDARYYLIPVINRIADQWECISNLDLDNGSTVTCM